MHRRFFFFCLYALTFRLHISESVGYCAETALKKKLLSGRNQAGLRQLSTGNDVFRFLQFQCKKC